MVSGSGGLNWKIMKILEIELSMRWKGTTCLCGKLWDWIGYWDINGEERIVGSVGGGEGIVWSEFYVWNVAKWNCAESKKKGLGGLDLVVGEKETLGFAWWHVEFCCVVDCGGHMWWVVSGDCEINGDFERDNTSFVITLVITKEVSCGNETKGSL